MSTIVIIACPRTHVCQARLEIEDSTGKDFKRETNHNLNTSKQTSTVRKRFSIHYLSVVDVSATISHVVYSERELAYPSSPTPYPIPQVEGPYHKDLKTQTVATSLPPTVEKEKRDFHFCVTSCGAKEIS